MIKNFTEKLSLLNYGESEITNLQTSYLQMIEKRKLIFHLFRFHLFRFFSKESFHMI